MAANTRYSRGKVIPLLGGAGTTAAPATATTGRELKEADQLHEKYLVEIRDNGAGATIGTNISLWGFNPNTSTWYLVKVLNGADGITLATGSGYSEIVEGLGLYSRVALSLTVSAGNVNVDVTPMIKRNIG